MTSPPNEQKQLIEQFERSSRRSRMIKLGLVLLVVASPLLWVIYKNVIVRKHISDRREAYEKSIALTDADKKELPLAISRARKAIDDAARAFVTATSPEALAAVTPTGEPCRLRITPPTMGADQSYIQHGSIDMNYFGNADYYLYASAADIKPPIRGELSTLDEIERKLKDGKADKLDLERVNRLERPRGNELIVVGKTTEPVVLKDSYVGGTVIGRAYAYSYDAGRVVCAADLEVKNSDQIEIHYAAMVGNVTDEMVKKDQAAQGTLERDLKVQMRFALASRLQAVP